MKIVIDIDEGILNDAKNGYVRLGEIADAVLSGTPLPKGHGDLIDVGYLREDFKTSRKISFADRMDISCIVDHAPTIIEADKEKDNG